MAAGGSALKLFRRSVRAALEFLLPRACVCCEAPLAPTDHAVVCALCLFRLHLLPFPQCQRCGHPTRGQNCRWCGLLPPFVRAARSVCWVPEGTGGSMVHRFKYGGWRRLSEPMAERMARLSFPSDVSEERSLIVPVPLGRNRLRERGFNQSELLGRQLGRAWGIAAADVITRTRTTASQTRLTPAGRLSNVAGAFQVTGFSAELRQRHVILVDDVVTTGATLNACAAALHAAGARVISYVTFGRARAAGDTP